MTPNHKTYLILWTPFTLSYTELVSWLKKISLLTKRTKSDSLALGIVLVFLPNPGSSLQAHYSCPYVTEKKISERDYIVSTPDHARCSRLYHINMIKTHYECKQLDKKLFWWRFIHTLLPYLCPVLFRWLTCLCHCLVLKLFVRSWRHQVLNLAWLVFSAPRSYSVETFLS